MRRKFGAPVLVLAIVLSCAFGAATSQASTFTASSYPATLSATSAKGNEVIKTEAGNVECAGSFSGTLSEASETVEITPTFTECSAFGFLEATVHMNGCKFKWHFNSMDIECPGTNKIEISALTCRIHIGTQTGVSLLSISTNSPHINVKANLSNLSYYVTTDDFLCPFNGTGAKTGAGYLQSVALTVGAGGVSLSIDP